MGRRSKAQDDEVGHDYATVGREAVLISRYATARLCAARPFCRLRDISPVLRGNCSDGRRLKGFARRAHCFDENVNVKSPSISLLSVFLAGEYDFFCVINRTSTILIMC